MYPNDAMAWEQVRFVAIVLGVMPRILGIFFAPAALAQYYRAVRRSFLFHCSNKMSE